MKKVCLSLIFGGLLLSSPFGLSASQAEGQEKKECAKKCYKKMYLCLVEGSSLSKGTCFNENVGQMLMCIDSRGMGSLKKKRLCFGQRKSCISSCK